MATQRTADIHAYILGRVGEHPEDVSGLTQVRFGLSRQAVSRHLQALVAQGLLTATGRTRARTYKLVVLENVLFRHHLSPDLQEDVVWREQIASLIQDAPSNIVGICEYGFTEMLNNAISHSEGGYVIVSLTRTAAAITMSVDDDGIGIFAKIQRDLALNDPRHALLELSKGKLTTDKAQHTGEGIFFTSRMFDRFGLLSGPLYYDRVKSEAEGWLIEAGDRTGLPGTRVTMEISLRATHTAEEVFDEFSNGQDNYGFNRTHVPVKLAKYESDQLVSRSAARRVLARFERFQEIDLDFLGVESIGQAFADEIFRVFRNAHPETQIFPLRCTDRVEAMIGRAIDNQLAEV